MLATVILLIITLAQLAFLAFLLLLILYSSSALFVWPPSIPTDRKSRRYIVNFIRSAYLPDAKIKIVDLGSGYGHLVIDLAKTFKNAEITGVELLWLPYLFSRISAKRFKKTRIIKDDLYKHDLSDYNAIVFFLRKDHHVDDKVKNEVKPGAIIVSNNFPLKNYQPKEVKEISDIFAKRTIYFYEF